MKPKPDTIPAAKPDEIPALVDELKDVCAQIVALTKRKKEIEIALAKAAETMPHERLADESREGRRVMLPGRSWRIPVVFTSDSLIKSFPDGSAKHNELKAIAGEKLGIFFKPPCKWESRIEDGQKFRNTAAEQLGEHAAAFIVACRAVDKSGIAKSSTVVAVDDAEAVS
jgi:hypothetical protein